MKTHNKLESYKFKLSLNCAGNYLLIFVNVRSFRCRQVLVELALITGGLSHMESSLI